MGKILYVNWYRKHSKIWSGCQFLTSVGCRKLVFLELMFLNELFNFASTTPPQSAQGSASKALELDLKMLTNLERGRTYGRAGGCAGGRASARGTSLRPLGLHFCWKKWIALGVSAREKISYGPYTILFLAFPRLKKNSRPIWVQPGGDG